MQERFKYNKKYAGLFETAMEWLKGRFKKKDITYTRYAEIDSSPNISNAVNQLYNKHGSFLGSSVVDEFLRSLNLRSDFAFSSDAVFNTKKSLCEIVSDLKNKIENKDCTQFAIPIDNNGYHVVIFIDTRKNN